MQKVKLMYLMQVAESMLNNLSHFQMLILLNFNLILKIIKLCDILVLGEKVQKI